MSCLLLWTKRWFLTAVSIHLSQPWCDVLFVSLKQLFCEREVGEKHPNPCKVFEAEIEGDYLSFISRTFLLFSSFLSLGMLSPRRFCLFLCHSISSVVLLKDTFFLHYPLTSHWQIWTLKFFKREKKRAHLLNLPPFPVSRLLFYQYYQPSNRDALSWLPASLLLRPFELFPIKSHLLQGFYEQ